MRRSLSLLRVFSLVVIVAARAASAATCFCDYLANGAEVKKTTDGGYTQALPGQITRCETHCKIELDAIKEEVARVTAGSCGKTVTVRVLSAIGTARYRDTASADVNVQCDTPAQDNFQVNQYAVKYVCGNSDKAGTNSGITAPGAYFTAINVHNSTIGRMEFRKKFVIALPEKEGGISPWSNSTLGPDGALEIDCPEIFGRTNPPANTLVKGFVVLEPFEAKQELDVVAVYTAGGDHVETLHTERVLPRLVIPAPRCRGDLNLSAATDTSTWTVIEVPPAVTSRVPFTPLPGSGSTVPNWITAVSGPAPGGFYTYEFRFCLCQGTSSPAINLNLWTDNEAVVLINNNKIGETSVDPTVMTRIVTGAAEEKFFATGTNTLTVRVRNRASSAGSPTATGLAVTGTVTARNGQCP